MMIVMMSMMIVMMSMMMMIVMIMITKMILIMMMIATMIAIVMKRIDLIPDDDTHSCSDGTGEQRNEHLEVEA